MMTRSTASPKQTVLQRLSNLIFGREEERRYGGVVSQEAQEGQNLVLEALRILQPSVHIYHRLNFIKEFCEYIRIYRIDNISVFYAPLSDLLDKSKNYPPEAYEVGFQFMAALIEGQYTQLGPHRSVLFRMINESEVQAIWKYRALTVLTNQGRDISPFEAELPQLLVKWLTKFAANALARSSKDDDSSYDSYDSDETDDSTELQQYYFQTDEHDFASLSEILQFATNLMKYNQSHFDENARHSIMIKVCTISDSAPNVEIIHACLTFFDAVLRYGRVPPQTVDILISSICRAVNIEAVCDASCRTMNNLLISTGHSGVMSLCGVLGNPKNKHTVTLLRGSVFFLGMANWGSHRIATLDVPPSAILASFLHALAWKQEIVAFEIILAVRRLVTKYGPDLSMEWDMVLLILDKIHAIVANYNVENNLFAVLKETVISIEELAAQGLFRGSKSHFFTRLSVAFVPHKSEADVLRTIAILFQDIHPSSPKWPSNLQHAVEVFFLKDRRTKIRQTVLTTLKNLYETYRALCGEELIEQVFLQFLSNIYKDPDTSIKNETLEIIGTIAKGVTSDIFFKLIDIFDKAIGGKITQTDETPMVALTGLLSIFRHKLQHLPSAHILGVWAIISKHAVDEEVYTRKTVLHFIANLLATNGHHLKYNNVVSPFVKTVKFVPMLTFNNSSNINNNQQYNLPARVVDVGLFPVSHMVDVLLLRLTSEPLAELYGIVLDILFNLLRNRYILDEAAASVLKLCDSICKLLNDRTLGGCVQDYQRDDPRRDRHWLLSYSIIGLICGYASPQDEITHKILMETLVAGLFLRPPCKEEVRLRIPKICLGVLSMCATLFPAKCYIKYLPAILSALTQTASSGKKHAYSAMEHLGVIGAVPQIVSNLAQTEFEALFRCLLLYIDPGKHLSHVVAMAYRNLILWFTACDVSMRYSYYLLITRSIESAVKDKDSNIGHVVLELLERYVYSNIDPVAAPEKSNSPVFDNAKSKTWMQGNSFITVRTGHMGWAEIIMRRPTGCVCWIQQFTFKSPISDCAFIEHQRVLSPVSALFPTCVSPVLVNTIQGTKTMDRDPFIPISPPNMSPPVSPTEPSRTQTFQKQNSSEAIRKPAHRVITRSDSSSGSIELEFGFPPRSFQSRIASPTPAEPSVSNNMNSTHSSLTQTTTANRDSSSSPITVSRESPITYETAYELPPLPIIDATTAAQAHEALSAHAPLSLGLDPIQESPRTIRMLARTHASLPIPHLPSSIKAKNNDNNNGETAESSDGNSKITEVQDTSEKEVAKVDNINLNTSLDTTEKEEQDSKAEQGIEIPEQVKVDLATTQDQEKTKKSDEGKEDTTTSMRNSSESVKIPTPERESRLGGSNTIRRSGSFLEGRKGKDFLESIKHRRNSSMSVELPSETPLRLSLFYPPLPSYDENELESPSFLADGHAKLNLEAQLMLHYGNSPTNPPLNTLGFLSPSKRASTDKINELGTPWLHTPKVPVSDRPDLGVSPRDGSRSFIPHLSLSPSNVKPHSQLSTYITSRADTSLDNALNTSMDSIIEANLDLDSSIEMPRLEESGYNSNINESSETAEEKKEEKHQWNFAYAKHSFKSPVINSTKSTDLASTTSVATVGSSSASSGSSFAFSSTSSDSSSSSASSASFAPSAPPTTSSSSSSTLSSTSTSTTKIIPLIPPIPISALTTSAPISTVSNNDLQTTPTKPSTENDKNETSNVNNTTNSNDCQITPRTSSFVPRITTSHDAFTSPVPRLVFPSLSPSTSADNSPVTSPFQSRYVAKRNVNFMEIPHRLTVSSDSHPSMSRSASEPNIFLASPPSSSPISTMTTNASSSSYISSPLASRAVNTSMEAADGWDDNSHNNSSSSPFNVIPKGLTTRLRNNTIHYGTGPRRSPRTFSASPIISSPFSTSHPHHPGTSSSFASSLAGAPASILNAFSPPNSPKPKTNSGDVLDPGFVFFHLRQMSSEKAKSLKSGEGVERAFNVLDRTHIAETHKIGIMYVGPNQSTEAEILGNTHGSPRYCEFLRSMGKQVRMSNASSAGIYTGGLDRSGVTDGKHFLFWEDRVTQVVYHVCTLMPNLENDPTFTNKKRHIGNDYVAIVYSDCPDYKQQIVLGAFNFVQITIYPLTSTHYRVEVTKRVDLPWFGPITRTSILDHKSLAVLVRTAAIHANILSILQQETKEKSEYVSNLEVRFKQIKTIKERYAKDGNEY